MPQSKEVHKEYMRKIRKAGNQAHSAIEERQYEDIGSQTSKVHSEGSQGIEYIKSQLSPCIVNDIERIIKWYERLRSGITPSKRWYNAYKYHVWDTSGRSLPANLLEVTK